MIWLAFYALPSSLIFLVIGVRWWWEEHQWHKDEQKLALLVALEESWLLPPAERRHG